MARLHVAAGFRNISPARPKRAIGCCELREVPSKSAFFRRGVSHADPPPHDVWPDRRRSRDARRAGRTPCRSRRETVEHPFGSIKQSMNQGALPMHRLKGSGAIYPFFSTLEHFDEQKAGRWPGF